MMDEVRIVDEIIDREGGFTATNDPDDKGGATFAGVTWKTYRNQSKHEGWEDLAPGADDKAYEAEYWAFAQAAEKDDGHPLRGRVRRIYQYRYIQPFDGIPACFRGPSIDFGVHAGKTRAVKTLQGALNVKVDGVAGEKTRHAAQTAARTRAQEVMVALLRMRLDHYARIYQGNPVQVKYARGWSDRAIRVYWEGVQDARDR